jgi:hypothetical protein
MTPTGVALVLFALLAQTTAPVPSEDGKAKAQVLLKEGARLYERGDLAAALEKFNQAYAEYASPKLLFNIGQASRDLHLFAEAMGAFERFLAEATDVPPDMEEEARRSVAELRVNLGRLHIECATTGAEISVDGKIVGRAPLRDLIWETPGKHQITAKHPDTTPAVEDVEVVVGSVQNVVIQLQPLPKAAEEPTAAHAQDTTKASARSKAREGRSLVQERTLSDEKAHPSDGLLLGRTWTWIAGGSAVVFAGAATIVGLSMQSKFDSLNKSCGSASGANYTGCSDSDINAVTTRRNIANVLWGLAGAATVTAGVLFFVEGHTVAVTPMAGSTTGVVARATF